MADIQAALPASFMQVANIQKISAKDHSTAGLQLASFLGVLKSQITHKDAALDLPVQVEAAALINGKSVDEDALPASNPTASQADAALPLAASAGLLNPLAADATAQTSVIAAALSLNNVVEKTTQPQVAVSDPVATEMEALLSEGAELAHAKTVPQGKPDALIKSNGAAIAAAQGQALPLVEGVAGAQTGVPLVADAKLESLAPVATAIPSLARGEVAAGSATPITVTHTFDQALRQAENKIHAAIETPVRSPAFAAEFSDKVVWLATRQGQLADLSLNPPQMGGLEVRLTLSGGEASAQFFSANPVVREAVDAALPKLREMMAQAGINLGEAEVREQAFGRREQPDARQQGAVSEAEGLMLPAAMVGSSGGRTSGTGLVDLYI